MATKELEPYDRIELVFQVSQLYLKGTTNPTHISKALGVTRVQALDLLDEYKAILHNSPDIREQAKDTLQQAVLAYAEITKRMWEAVEEAETAGDTKTKATTLKSLADIHAREVELLQKAGLYDDSVLGDQLAEAEDKQTQIMAMIREVSAHCPNCKFEIARRIGKITGHAEGVILDVVEAEVVG